MTRFDHAALDAIEVAAMADFYRAAPAQLRAAHGIEARVLPAATLLMSRGIDPGVVFRRVAGVGAGCAPTEGELDAALVPMQSLGASFAVALAPEMPDALLGGWLQKHGLQPGYAWMKFARDCGAIPDARTDLQVRTAGPESAEDFGRVIQQGFGLPAPAASWVAQLVDRPGWCCVVACDGTDPVAAGVAFISGEYAWLGLGATLASHRRRGAQNALLARRLQEAARRGARVAVTETGERLPDKPSNSYRNILRSGFIEAYLRQNYMSPARA